MAMLGTVLGVLGSVAQAAGMAEAGKRQQAATNWEAQHLDIKAKQELAAAGQQAAEQRRKRDLAVSRLTAVSAASGFTATDPTTLQLGEEITKRGELQAGLEQFGGADRAAGLHAQATGRRLTGQAAAIGARYSAFGSLLSGVGSGLARYNTGFGGGGGGYYYGSSPTGYT